MAEYVISCGGVVFGAKFDDTFQVVHGYAESQDNCAAFVGSKYLQSHINKAYVDVKGFLEKGRLVLFSGTGCQVHALHSFLKYDYENLICMDVACHGVTSERLLNTYLNYIGKKFHSNACRINFRDKSSGWKGYSVRVDFENGQTYIKKAEDDLFMRAYLSGYYLRPSCYECKFRGSDRVADFTLADFWGIDRLMPEMDDDKGTSLVFIHSEKAKRVFKELNNKFLSKEADVEMVIKENPSITSALEKPLKRLDFIKEISMAPLNKVVKKYCRKPITVYELKVLAAKVLKAGRNDSRKNMPTV